MKKSRKRKPWTEAQKQAARNRWASKKLVDAIPNTSVISSVNFEEAESTTGNEFEIMQKINDLMSPLPYSIRGNIARYFASKYQ